MIIFYSWQSDLPNNTNRGFIEDSLERAAKSLRNDGTLQVEPVIDRDTSGIPGAPNIAEAILKKIERADIFVADVSIINSATEGRATPNPNVLLELGYALKCLGPHSIILVQNTAYGGLDLLPFDLKMNRVITYSLQGGEEKASARTRFVNALQGAITLILKEKASAQEAAPPAAPSVEAEVQSIIDPRN